MLTSEFDRFYYSLNNFKVLSMEVILVMQVIYWEACFRHMLEAVTLARYVQYYYGLQNIIVFRFGVLKKFLG